MRPGALQVQICAARHDCADTATLKPVTLFSRGRDRIGPGRLVQGNVPGIVKAGKLVCPRFFGNRQVVADFGGHYAAEIAGPFARGVGAHTVGTAKVELLRGVQIIKGKLAAVRSCQTYAVSKVLDTVQRIGQFGIDAVAPGGQLIPLIIDLKIL